MKKYGFRRMGMAFFPGLRIWTETRPDAPKFSKEDIRDEMKKQWPEEPIDSFDYCLNDVKLNSFEEIHA